MQKSSDFLDVLDVLAWPVVAIAAIFVAIQISDFLDVLEILAWPVVVIVAIFVVRPYLSSILSGTKITLAVAGASIETTLPELKQIFEEQYAEVLSSEHVDYLRERLLKGRDRNGDWVGDSNKASNRRVFLRPLRNAGLVLTVPRSTFLSQATDIEISGLGRLYLRALEGMPKSGA